MPATSTRATSHDTRHDANTRLANAQLPSAHLASAAEPDSPGYEASVAHTTEQIRAAQRLRHQVFAEEMGARLHTPLAGHDIDDVDEIADHLVVTERGSDTIVGTYRLVPPGRSERLYSDGEFDLASLTALRPTLIEAGRSCVHPDHRNGTVINLLWSALARYVLLSGHRYLAGCASVPLSDGGRAAHTAWRLAEGRHAAPDALRVTPRQPWRPVAPAPEHTSPTHLPPLLRGYLRVGAWLCEPPAHDPEFHTADFFTLLDMERMNERYRRYFLGETASGAER
ncbi:GNAT family N-acetyltransferase [Streptomyces sp. JJ38]|uniref:GNAT family N-acetyltransferase n=1 Tax=Streptomyces sp. JJ38 TaxID=2738128 RepID=UPI001C5788FA|nr:GNAT family N-acyltransferase [Streptomyces sp. JJ38]MBW1597710.1 GNAT family N-acetyltransferase [Streptomyces sp. JJ38]